jgi:hypothetical protein
MNKGKETLAEIVDSLPNGFHDAMIQNLKIDYVKREAEFTIDVWVGDLQSKDDSIREKYRSGKLLLSSLLYCVIGPPDSSYQYDKPAPLWVDAGPIDKLSAPLSASLPKPIPADSFAYWFFVRDWNAFIYIAAKSARLIWDN